MRRRVAFAGAVLGVLVCVVSCSGSGPAGPSATASATGPAVAQSTLPPSAGQGRHPRAAWPTFGRDAARTGAAAGVAAAGPLSIGWQAHLDGAVYGQPLLVGHLDIAAT